MHVIVKHMVARFMLMNVFLTHIFSFTTKILLGYKPMIYKQSFLQNIEQNKAVAMTQRL